MLGDEPVDARGAAVVVVDRRGAPAQIDDVCPVLDRGGQEVAQIGRDGPLPVLVDDGVAHETCRGSDPANNPAGRSAGPGDDAGDLGSMALFINRRMTIGRGRGRDPIDQVGMLGVDPAVEDGHEFTLAGPASSRVLIGRNNAVGADDHPPVIRQQLRGLERDEPADVEPVGEFRDRRRSRGRGDSDDIATLGHELDVRRGADRRQNAFQVGFSVDEAVEHTWRTVWSRGCCLVECGHTDRLIEPVAAQANHLLVRQHLRSLRLGQHDAVRRRRGRTKDLDPLLDEHRPHRRVDRVLEDQLVDVDRWKTGGRIDPLRDERLASECAERNSACRCGAHRTRRAARLRPLADRPELLQPIARRRRGLSAARIVLPHPGPAPSGAPDGERRTEHDRHPGGNDGCGSESRNRRQRLAPELRVDDASTRLRAVGGAHEPVQADTDPGKVRRADLGPPCCVGADGARRHLDGNPEVVENHAVRVPWGAADAFDEDLLLR